MNRPPNSQRFELRSSRMTVAVESFGSWISEVSESGGENLLALRNWDTPVPTFEGGVYDTSSEKFHADYMGGWHTLFPNSGEESHFDGVDLPFHGDVATKNWEISSHSNSKLELETDSSLPLSIRRVITLEDSIFRIEDEITNLSPKGSSFLFGHHPVFPLSENLRLDFPNYELETISISGFESSSLFGEGLNSTHIDFENLNLQRPLKGLFNLSNFKRGWFGLGRRDSEAGVIFSWDTETMPNFWIWIENMSPEFPWFGRSKFLGLEPQTAPNPFGLANNADSSDDIRLDPNESVKTWVEFTYVSDYKSAIQMITEKGGQG